jgi:Ca2+-binding EF-hand superfamily protein
MTRDEHMGEVRSGRITMNTYKQLVAAQQEPGGANVASAPPPLVEAQPVVESVPTDLPPRRLAASQPAQAPRLQPAVGHQGMDGASTALSLASPASSSPPADLDAQDIMEAFQSVDKDGSGSLDRSEVRKLCETLGLSVDVPTLNQIMGELDTDSSGAVDFDEFRRWWIEGDAAPSTPSVEGERAAREDDAGSLNSMLKARRKEEKRLAKERKKEEKRLAKERKAQEKALEKARKKEEKQRKNREVADASELEPVLSSGGGLDRLQVREMARIQLELDGWDSGAVSAVSDAFIDELFDRFDADKSGIIDDAEWELLVPALRIAMEELERKQADKLASSAAGHMETTAKQLDRAQVHEMARIQLELDGWDSAAVSAVSDAFIDELFDRFDADKSGIVDDAEWELLVPALRIAMEELQGRTAESETQIQVPPPSSEQERPPDYGTQILGQSGKQLDRGQVHEMVRIQLELDGWDPNGKDYVSDAWIDDLFYRFDADQSGIVDDSEWEQLVPAMRDAMEELQRRGGMEAQPLRPTKMTTYGTAGPGPTATAEPVSEPGPPTVSIEGPADPNAGVVICPVCHFTMTWGTNSYSTYTCDLCQVSKTGERWVCEKCSSDQCSACNPHANLPPKLTVRRRFKDFHEDRFEAESQEGFVQDFVEYHRNDMAASDSDAVELRVHIHEAKELAAKDGTTSDPYVRAKCFGKEKKTSVAPPGTEAVFDEELQFVATQTDLIGGLLTLECWDKDRLSRDDLIGTFSFDLSELRKRDDKEYYKAWVGLFNTADSDDPSAQGEQGKLCVSVTILEPGDELPRRPGQEIAEDGDAAEFDLHVKLYKGEGLPRIESSKSGLADPYISVVWANRKTRTKVAPHTLAPEWMEELVMRVLVEQSANAPPRSDVVLIRLREQKTAGVKEVAHGVLYLSDVMNKQWDSPCWLNLYGAVRRYDDPFLKRPLKIEQTYLMNEGKMPGLMYRGRVLLSAAIGSAVCDSEVLERSMSARKHNALPKELPPFPATTWYCLKVAVVSGCDLPERSALAVRVTWGLPKTGYAGTDFGQGRHHHGHKGTGFDAWTQAESSADGMAQWDRLLTLQGEWPVDLSQVPDIIIDLIDTETNERIHCVRLDLRHPFIRSPKDMVPKRRFGDPTLDCDWFDLQVDSEYVQEDNYCEPQLLLSLGVECGKEPTVRKIKCPHARDSLAVVPEEEQTIGVAPEELEHPWWPVDELVEKRQPEGLQPALAEALDGPKAQKQQRDLAMRTRLASLSLEDLRAQAEAEGIGPARLREAAALTDHRGQPLQTNSLHRTKEGAALAHLLTKRLPDAAECQCNFRCHVYQARSLDAGFNSDDCQVYVEARLWDADGEVSTRQTKTITTPGRSAQWFETLEVDNVTITAPDTRSIQVRMAADVVVAVYQVTKTKGSLFSSKGVASMIGRLRVRLSTMEARFEEPMWVPLRLPGTAVSAGELLVGFQLMSSDGPLVPLPSLHPTLRRFDVDIAIVGARGLEDTSALLLSTVDESLVKYELDELEGQTNVVDGQTLELAEGENPNYLMPDGKECYNRLFSNVELPVEPLYAPSLTFSVHAEGTSTL